MVISYYGYRDWAIQILENLKKIKPWWQFIHVTVPQESKDSKSFEDVKNSTNNLFVGWSWMVPKEVYENSNCYIMHLSPLPKYRGGSPLQHQIMNGEKMSAVTILKMREKVDQGEIYSQTPFSLEGTLDEIFARVVEIGTNDIFKVFDDRAKGIKPIPQDESKATLYKRRTPEESELTIEDFKSKTAEQLYNFIRALADPYPNAFIKCKDGKKLYFTGAKYE